MEILIILASIGLSYILADSYIMERLRNFTLNHSEFIYQLITCHQCCSFWSGLILGLIFIQSWECILFALASSGIAFLLDKIISRNEW